MAQTAKEKRDARDARLRAEGAEAAIEKLNRESTLNPGGVASATGPIAAPQHAGAKVTVACKIGVAYFDLQLCEMKNKDEQSMAGLRPIRESVRVGQVVRLRGTAYPRGTPPAGFPEKPEIVGGAALNPGIDKGFWDAWVEQNELNPVVINRMVFAHENVAMVRGEALERAGLLSGLDPVDPKNLKKDPRMPKSTREGVAEIEPGVRAS